MKNFLIYFFLIAAFHVNAQTPAVSYLGTETLIDVNLKIYDAPNGKFLITGQNKTGITTSDTSYAMISMLSSAMIPEWTRKIKVLKQNQIWHIESLPNGDIQCLLSAYNVTTKYYNFVIKVSNTGMLLQTYEVLDSSSVNAGPARMQVNFSDGSGILINYGSLASNILRFMPSGQLQFSKGLQYQGNNLIVNAIEQTAGTKKWVAVGGIVNTSLGFFLKMEDTVIKKFHVYNFSNGSTGITNVEQMPNGNYIIAAAGGTASINLAEVDSNGVVIWKKSHHGQGIFLNTMKVDATGLIWLSGSTNPVVAGYIANFSATGDIMNQTLLFQASNNLSGITGLLQLGNQEFLVGNSYGHSSSYNGDILFHRVSPALDFACFEGFTSDTFILATVAYQDSVTFFPTWILKNFDATPNLSFPIEMTSTTLLYGNLCGTSIEENKLGNKISITPNPAVGYIKINGLEKNELILLYSIDGRLLKTEIYNGSINLNGLQKGLLIIKIPKQEIHLKFIHE